MSRFGLLPERITATKQIVKKLNDMIAHHSYGWVFHDPRHFPLKGIVLAKEKPLYYINDDPIYKGKGAQELLKIIQE